MIYINFPKGGAATLTRGEDWEWRERREMVQKSTHA